MRHARALQWRAGAYKGKTSPKQRHSVFRSAAIMRVVLVLEAFAENTRNAFGAAALSALLFCSPAHSSEVWLCRYKAGGSATFSSVLELTNDLLVEHPYATRYRVVENNRHALIAQHHYAEFDPVSNEPNIFTTIIILEKPSLRYSQTVVLVGNLPRQWTGACQEQSQSSGAADIVIGAREAR
jgi:hypothetical protein